MQLLNSDFNKNNSEKYFKKILINGQQFKAMIDTGSSDCTIKNSLAELHRFTMHPYVNQLVGFGKDNNIFQSPGLIFGEINLNGVTASEVPTRVVPDDVQPVDVIIGRSFTELPHITYRKFKDELTLENLDLDNMLDPANEHQSEIPTASVNLVNITEDGANYTIPAIFQPELSTRRNYKSSKRIVNKRSTHPTNTKRRHHGRRNSIWKGTNCRTV